ncbi:Protein SUPPRESSOR OF npr1-1, CONSTITUTIVE 1, partial [Mucuna pruriens]
MILTYTYSLSSNDAGLVKEIVNLVLKWLVKPSIISKGLVGIEDKIANVESLISKEPKDDTRVIGIWGMGGIGKTTLAEVVFNKLQSQYGGSYFLADERDQSEKYELISLKKIIFSKLLGYDVKIDTPNSLPEDIVRRIVRMKVFIVLDDVNISEHFEKLLGTTDNFGSGSRIIVTTRDEQVLRAIKADEIYHLKEISSDEALQLFNLNAFKQSAHQLEYKVLSEKVVHYAHGIPLIVKVLGGLLCGKTKEEWQSMLDKLFNKLPPTKVYEALKLSYDSLDRKQQQIFLDLACFFLRTEVTVNKGHLEFLLKDNGSDNSVAFELGRLKDKALITFSENNIVCMHDSLQEMALEIVRQESIDDPGSRSRLWDSSDINKALENDKVTEAIRSIRIDLKTINKQILMPHIFAKMKGLKFLEISGYYNSNDQLIRAADSFQLLTTELRFLYWVNFPLKSLPENFSGEELVILNLQWGKMEKLWDGVKNLVNLKELDLSFSQKLKELPNLSTASNLEVLILNGCSMLTNIHPSIFSLAKLEKLDLWQCESLTILTSDSHLCSLRYLKLDSCENLWKLSLIFPPSLENISTSDCKSLQRLPELPQFLKTLDVSCCESLQSLPEFPPSLETITACKCKSLKSIPKLPQFLKTLDVDGCESLQSLPKFPPSFEKISTWNCKSLQSLPELPHFLKTLDVRGCESLQSLPEFPPLLETITAWNCKSLQSVPELPQFLKTLDVSACESLQSLPELPQSLKTLDVFCCESLHSLPEFPPSFENISTWNCKLLKSIPELPQFLKTLDVRGCESLQSLPEFPRSLETITAWNCKSLESVPELPQFLKTLDVRGCESLQSLPEFSPSLEILTAWNCKSLKSVPKIPQFIKTLDVHGCESLQSLPELPGFLKTLDVHGCESLQSLPELPGFLKTLDVHGCDSLQSLPKLPQFLKTLDVDGCESLQCLPKLPPSFENISIWNCKSLQSLPELPQFLKTLDVRGCESLQSLPELPQFLKTLDVRGCESLQSLPMFPPLLETISASNCKSLMGVPELPQFLKTLNVSGCESLQSLPELPQCLKTLDVDGCESLQSLPEFPPSFENISTWNCKSLLSLPELPQLLKALDLRGCESLQSLPKFPPSLNTISASNCKSLKNVPVLPQFLKTLDVHGCKSLQSLPELPQFLKTLDVSGWESLQSLPEFPPSLETLHVRNCKSLESLPELPPSLETLDASYCESLKSVLLFPSTAIDQLMENRRWIQFQNCFNLDEHSLGAIGLNAQINIMKFANQHLSTPWYHHVKLQYGGTYEVVYVHPGSSVPEWLEYKTTEDNVIIDLSFAPPSPFLDFIFCFVFGNSQSRYTITKPKFYITISGEGEGEKDRKYMEYLWEDPIESDHVCVVYYKGKFDFLRSRAKNETRFKIQVKIESDDGMTQEVLKGFGVSPIGSSPYSRLTEQMELRDSMYHFN